MPLIRRASLAVVMVTGPVVAPGLAYHTGAALGSITPVSRRASGPRDHAARRHSGWIAISG